MSSFGPVLACLMMSTAAVTSFNDPMNPDRVAVQWSGADGKIDRAIAFRTSELVDWISLWQGQFGDRSVPMIDFSRFEVVGLILPRSEVAWGFYFTPELKRVDQRVILTYGLRLSLPTGGAGTGSLYAMAVIAKMDNEIAFRAGPQGVEMEILDERTRVAQPLLDRDASGFPQLPLQPGGHAETGASSGPTYLTVFGGAPFQNQRDPQFALVHVKITPDPSLKAELVRAGGPLPGEDEWIDDKFISQGRHEYETKAGPLNVIFTVDGRNHTLEVGDEVFDLADGNFIEITIGTDREVHGKQLQVVNTEIGDGEMDKVIDVFDQNG